MAIISTELKKYKAAVNNDTTSNGGRMSTSLITSGVRNNVFPNVSESERTAGVTRYRKTFIKVANDDDLTAYNTKIHLVTTTGADDYVTIFEGTDTDTYADVSSPREYGCGVLEANVNAGDTEITVQVENSVMDIFNTSSADNVIWIGNTTNDEYFENVEASKVDDVYTLTLSSGDSLSNSYTTTNTYVSSCIDAGDVKCSFDTVVVTSTSGTFDDSGSPILVDNIGTVYDSWTLTFTNATTYTITGANEGLLASGGNISGDASPTNLNYSKPYFTIQSAAFGGTYEAGDTITFKTYPATANIWYKEVVPAGSASYSNNTWTERMICESA